MKKTLLILSICISLSTAGYCCASGGPGSTSCTFASGGFWGLFSVEYSVSCQSGYYACCTSNSGKCIKEGSASLDWVKQYVE